MKKLYSIIFVLTFVSLASIAQRGMNTTSCEILMAQDPITRTTALGEENVVNGNFQALAQQYNGLTGAIKGVRFFGRANPSLGVASIQVKAVLYNVNQGKPNQILASTTVTLDSASTSYEVNAYFSAPYTLTTTSFILSIEPVFATTDDFFIVRNDYGNGQNLNMSKIKQGGLWYLGAANGYDMDLYIFPIGTATVTSNFTSSTSALTATFTNTSSSSTSYYWDFGDGTSSTATTPAPHTYSTANTYSVKLLAFHSDITCVDSITKSVTVITTGISEKNIDNQNNLILLKNPVQNILALTSNADLEIEIYNVMGSLILKEKIKKETPSEINVSEFVPGIYFVQTGKGKAIKFVKVN